MVAPEMLRINMFTIFARFSNTSRPTKRGSLNRVNFSTRFSLTLSRRFENQIKGNDRRRRIVRFQLIFHLSSWENRTLTSHSFFIETFIKIHVPRCTWRFSRDFLSDVFYLPNSE